MTSRIALHMAGALPLRSAWHGRPAPKPPLHLWRGWMMLALLPLATAVLVVAVTKILRLAL